MGCVRRTRHRLLLSPRAAPGRREERGLIGSPAAALSARYATPLQTASPETGQGRRPPPRCRREVAPSSSVGSGGRGPGSDGRTRPLNGCSRAVSFGGEVTPARRPRSVVSVSRARLRITALVSLVAFTLLAVVVSRGHQPFHFEWRAVHLERHAVNAFGPSATLNNSPVVLYLFAVPAIVGVFLAQRGLRSLPPRPAAGRRLRRPRRRRLLDQRGDHEAARAGAVLRRAQFSLRERHRGVRHRLCHVAGALPGAREPGTRHAPSCSGPPGLSSCRWRLSARSGTPHSTSSARFCCPWASSPQEAPSSSGRRSPGPRGRSGRRSQSGLRLDGPRRWPRPCNLCRHRSPAIGDDAARRTRR